MRRTGYTRERSLGSFELRYELGTDAATGQRRTATVTLRGTRKVAERELHRLLGALDTGEHIDPNRITVRDWLRTWLDATRQKVAPPTAERYAEIVSNFLTPALGNLPLSKLGPVRRRTIPGHPAAGLTVRRAGSRPAPAGTFIAFCRARAVEQQLVARNPWEAFKKRLPKVERREMAVLTTEQSQKLLDAIRHSRVYWPVLIAVATGARRGEILALRWRNVDLDRGGLRVVESLEQTKAGLRFKAPKSEKTRAIALPALAVEEFRRLKRTQAEELLKLGMRQGDDTLVRARADGEPMQPRSLTHEFTRLVGRIRDLPRVRFHDLRHTHATQLLLAGVHPKVAPERLGHSTISVTLDLYSHVTTTMQEDAAAKIDVAFRDVKMSSRWAAEGFR